MKQKTKGSEIENVETMKFGERIELSTVRYESSTNGTLVNQPDFVVFDSGGEDVTSRCLHENIFTPLSIGNYTILARDTNNDIFAIRTILVVQAEDAAYQNEEFESVLDTMDDIKGVHYNTPASGLGLPKTVRIVTNTGAVYDAKVNWDTSDYRQNSMKNQTFRAKGSIILPTNISGSTPNLSVEVTIDDEEPFYIFQASEGEYDIPSKEETPIPDPDPNPIPAPQKPLKAGIKIIAGTGKSKAYYTILKEAKSTNGAVSYAVPYKKKSKIVIIPAFINVGGKKYLVTQISKNAFKHNKNIRKITLGTEITKINAYSFYKAKNLKEVKIKSKKIKTILKKAFSGIHKKAVIKVPKEKKKKYKKKLRNAGCKIVITIK